MKKTYKGGCHCGAVTFEADLDLTKGSYKCNCAICMKTRTWIAAAKPEDFRLLSGEAELTDYKYSETSAHHLFCKTCGVRSFAWKDNTRSGGTMYAVRINCLEGVPDEELAGVPVTCVDGRNGDFAKTPAETRYL